MRIIWESFGAFALVATVASCSGESRACDAPCDDIGAQGCYTYVYPSDSGEERVVARAVCKRDETAGCASWDPVEICDKTCADNVCDSTGGSCVSDCSEAGALSCSGTHVTECREAEPGCFKRIETEQCPKYCSNGQCSDCPESCEAGAYQCYGKTLKQCANDEASGCMTWKTVKTCAGYCKADLGKCTDDLPACTLKNGVTAKVRQWTDGDTVWVVAKSDGTCNDYEYDAEDKKWKNIRWRIRVHGIDAPECSKKQNNYYYYTCIQDSKYTNENERYGYESWKWAETLLPYNSEVILTCDDYDKNTGICEYDATADDEADEDEVVYNRFLTYIGYSKNSASYDFSTELAREGLAFSNTKFSSSKRKAICDASKEAKDSGKNIWSLGSSVSEVLKKMGSSKQKGLKNMAKTCGW